METSYGDRGADTSDTLPTGTVTFVLGDVVGSTAMWEAEPNAAASVIAALDGIVAKLVEARGGAKPVEQGEGDSFVAAFPQAMDAALFVVDLQRAFANERWPERVAPAVRIGVHTGDARLQDGLYRGDTLNRCARIRALAHGGQILLSGTTADLIVDGLDDGLFLKDLGVHRLRDLSRPEHLRQLCHPDLPIQFPPLLSLDRLPHNLPLQLTSFVGRDDEVDEIRNLLHSRVVTLTGAGGSGKTRLALEVAAAVVDRFEDGAWLVDLSAVTDPELVARMMAVALGVHEMPDQDVLSAVEQYLRARHALLVVDNCEHLIDTCASAIERLVSSCEAVSVIATSREPLGLAGETTYRVPSLSLPDDNARECASVELFLARAVAVRPAFGITDDNAKAIATICRRLDGLPLAIELAAARCRAFSPQQIADQLEERFSLLSGGPRTAVPRQRTLEASVSWSVDLLDDEERTLFRRLSVFPGPFSLDAAEAVGAFDDRDSWHVVDALTSLVDKSLVQLDERDNDVRYRLLETIRHFAAQQLLAAEESNDVRDAHASFYFDRVHQLAPGLVGPAVTEVSAALDRDLDNIRATQAWLVHTRDVERALDLVRTLAALWSRIGGPEVLRGIEDVLALDGGRPESRAWASLAAAEAAWVVGDLGRNLQLLDAADEIVATLADPTLTAFADLFRGWTNLILSHPLTEELLARAYDYLRADEMYYWSADAMLGLAFAYALRGDFVSAGPLLAEGVRDARLSGNPVAISRALVTNAIVEMQSGDIEAAEGMLEEAAPLYARNPDTISSLMAEAVRGWIACARGAYAEALALGTHAAETSRRAGLSLQLAWATFICLATQRAIGASDVVAHLTALEATTALSWAPAWCRAVRAELALADGDGDRARALIDSALAEVDEIRYAGLSRGRCLLVSSRIRRACGDELAEDDAHRALSNGVGSGLREDTLEALELLASFAAETGRFDDAARLLGAARHARSEAGIPVPPIHQAEVDATFARLASAVDSQRLDALLEEGASLDLAGAQAYAERGRGARGRPTSGWQSLTPTEERVVELTASGLKNADIAQQMFIAVPTVKTHLAHIFAKLGVSTRAELAARAAHRDPASMPESGR